MKAKHEEDVAIQSKKIVAESAIELIKNDYPNKKIVLGIGTGSTTDYFIQMLPTIRKQIDQAIPSSIASEKQLRDLDIPVANLSEVKNIDVYIDGADQVNHYKELIKGYGGALTREKILATAAEQFIVIVDEAKITNRLNKVIPIEVLPFARSFVGRQLISMNATPYLQEGYITDNGYNIIHVDISIGIPLELEILLTQMPGVLECGIFARRAADQVLIGTSLGCKKLP